jgi:hypothetical protein
LLFSTSRAVIQTRAVSVTGAHFVDVELFHEHGCTVQIVAVMKF